MDPNDLDEGFDENMSHDADEDECDVSDDQNLSESVPVKPLLVTDFEPLVCQNNGCDGPLKVPIKQCLAGHLFCSDCHRGHVNCMLCAENKLFPAPSVDAILNTIMDVCPFEFCKKKIPFYQLEDHFEGCLLSVKCPIPQCAELLVSRYKLELHLTEIHGNCVDIFYFGFPVHFAFGMHNDTRVLIEMRTKCIFVVYYEVGAGSTLFKFFGIQSFGSPQFTYRIMDQIGKTALSAESTVPIIALKDGVDKIGFGGSLSNQLRTADKGYLHCSFVITPKPYD